MYKSLPEFNKICVKANRDRAYSRHLEALRKIRPSIDVEAPLIPNRIGRDKKKYELEKQRAESISKQNNLMYSNISETLKEEHYPKNQPKRPFTLQGSYQKEQMTKITSENHKILKAVQTKKPNLNRNDWLLHRLDHQYQVQKMSEHQRTVPMSEILKKELRSKSIQSEERLTIDQKTFQDYGNDDEVPQAKPPKTSETPQTIQQSSSLNSLNVKEKITTISDNIFQEDYSNVHLNRGTNEEIDSSLQLTENERQDLSKSPEVENFQGEPSNIQDSFEEKQHQQNLLLDPNQNLTEINENDIFPFLSEQKVSSTFEEEDISPNQLNLVNLQTKEGLGIQENIVGLND